jgi:hypothetical protein
MSSGSIGGVGQGLYQFFQTVTANGRQPPAPAAAATANSASGADSSQTAQTTALVGGHHHHHHGHGQTAQQIQNAVTSALQSTQGDFSSDPNTVIQDAIEKVLKNAGAGGTGATGANGQPTTADPAASPATDPSSASANATSSRQAFGQLLQSFGVDPQQFHNDFLAAIRDAQNGHVNSGTALQSFPPGSVIDETA